MTARDGDAGRDRTADEINELQHAFGFSPFHDGLVRERLARLIPANDTPADSEAHTLACLDGIERIIEQDRQGDMVRGGGR